MSVETEINVLVPLYYRIPLRHGSQARCDIQVMIRKKVRMHSVKGRCWKLVEWL